MQLEPLGVTMAKKRAKRPAPKPAEERDELLALRCTARYKAWVKRFANSEYVNHTQLIAIALKQLSVLRSFEPPPER